MGTNGEKPWSAVLCLLEVLALVVYDDDGDDGETRDETTTAICRKQQETGNGKLETRNRQQAVGND